MGKITETITNYVVGTDFSRLHESAIRATKRCILDCLGVAIAGSKSQGVREVVDLVTEMGGFPQSKIWVHRTRVPAAHAAFVNSVMSHALDYDDSYRPGILHPTCSVLPAALSICEKLGEKNGKDLILSVCLGNDLACRLAKVLKPYESYEGKLPPWRNSAVCGAMGCVAAVSQLLNFSPKATQNALGIVYSQVAGNKQCEIDGATVKRMQPGFMAQAAIFACLLAEKGVSGAKDVFDGTYGFFDVYGNRGLRRTEVLEGIGERYLVEEIGFKLFPCCGLVQAPVEATLYLRRIFQLHSDQIRKIRVVVPTIVMDEVGREYVIRENPRVDAQFNLSYNVATAMMTGDVTLEDYEMKAVTDPDRVEYAEKIEVVCDPSFKGGLPVTVEIHTTEGDTFTKTLNERKGDITNPLSDEELCKKFIKCLGDSNQPDIENNKRGIPEIILHLEKVKCLDELIQTL